MGAIDVGRLGVRSLEGSKQSKEEVTILDVYRLESQEISVDFSDGTFVTLAAQEILAWRDARTKVSESPDQ